MKLPPARAGVPLLIKDRELDFTLRAMRKTSSRWGVHSMLYAADPWAVISGAVTERVTTAAERKAALSWVRQGREFYTAAERATSIEAKPLLYYYAFLNLGKAISVARKRRNMVGKIQHGVAAIDSRGHTPLTAEVVIQPSRTYLSAVDELHRALEHSP